MLRKFGLHPDRAYSTKAVPAADKSSVGQGLALDGVLSSPPDPEKRIRPHSSLGLPHLPKPAADLSGQHSGEKVLVRSPSNANSVVPNPEHVIQTKVQSSDPLGLHLVCDNPGPGGDIIFVHGLGGGARRTWSWNRDVDNFWPRWLAKEDGLSTHRIFIYGYNSNFKGAGTNLNIIDFAKDLLFQMLVFSGRHGEDGARIGQLPIIFVAHSMGGLVVKKAFVLGKHDGQYVEIIAKVRGMIFLATPHRGAQHAKILNAILSTSLLGASPKAYIDDLDTHSRTLQDINEQFRTSSGELELMSFYETRKTSFGIKKSIIVERESATLGYPKEQSVPLNADHHTICKFRSQDDENYRSIKGILQLWASTIPSIEAPRSTSPIRRKSSTADLYKSIESIMGVRERAEDDLNELRSKAVNGTCQWIMRKPGFSKWFESISQSPSIFWLVGLPAMGKTTLASYVIDYLLSNTSGGDCQYHFFSASHQGKRTAAYCLRSIASQLAFHNEEFRGKLFDLHTETGISFSSQMQNYNVVWEKIFKGIIFKMSIKPLYWVLDAFDEVDLPAPLISSLLKIDSSTPIKVFITSRPTKILSGSATCGPHIYTWFLSEEDTKSDIQTYVRDTVSETLPNGEQKTRDNIIEQILAKAGGSFLWVKLALENLSENWHTHEDIQKTLTEMPKGMESLYARMLKKVEIQPPRLEILAKKILTWMALSWRPLSMTELQTALEPEYSGFVSFQHTISQICGNFIAVDNDKVSLVHMTARQFLLAAQDGVPPFIDSELGHEQLAIVCLRFLSDEKWKRIFKTVDAFTSASTGTTVKKNRLLLAEEGNPMLGYSVCYFAYHVSKANLHSDELMVSLKTFFTQYCLSWIEAIALSRNLRYLTRSARWLKTYAKRRRHRRNLNSLGYPLSPRDVDSDDSIFVQLWAIDFLRIVGKFGLNLIHSPSSINRVVPFFCPSKSMVASVYGTREGSISVTGLRSDGWDDCLASVPVGKEEAASKIMATDAYFLTLISSGGTIGVWYAETCEEARKLHHGEYVAHMELDRSGKILATAGSESYRAWDIASGKQLHQLERKSPAMTMFLAFGTSETELIVGTDDCSVTCYDLETSKQRWQSVVPASDEYTGCPLIMKISPDLSKVAMAWRGNPPVVWDLHSTIGQRPLRCRIHGNTDPLMSPLMMHWQADANSILILCHSNTLVQWHIYDEEQRGFEHIKPYEMTISKDGNFLLTIDYTGTIGVYNFPRLGLIYQLINRHEYIEKLAFSPDSQRFYDLRGSICNVWEPEALVRPDDAELEDWGSSMLTEPVIAHDKSRQTQVTALAAGFTDKYYCAGRDDGSACIHDARDGRKIRKVSGHSSHTSVIVITWSRSGRYLVSGDDSGRILAKRVDMKQENTFAIFPSLDFRLDEPVRQILFNETERLLLISTASFDKIWDLKMKRQVCIREWNSTRRNRWIQHPLQSELLIWIDANIVHTYIWEQLEHADPKTLVPTEPLPSNTSRSHGNVIHWVALTTNKQYIVYLSSSGSADTRLSNGVHLEFLATSNIQTQHPHTLAGDCRAGLAAQIKYLIGIYQDRIVFLDHDYWLCTSEINTSLSGEIKRHFFLPKDWLNHSTLHMATMNEHGTFFCPKHGDVAIVRNGMRL